MNKRHKWLFWCSVVVSTLTLIGVYVAQLYKLDFASTPGAFGTFGDYVGGVFGAVTGLVSVVFLYFTYQKQQEIFLKQQDQTLRQQFEQNFFQLLNGFRGLLPNMRNKSGEKGKEVVGLAFFKTFRGLIEKDIDDICKPQDALTNLNALQTREKINEKYVTAFQTESDQLGHYFRTLYHLLKYIDGHCPTEESKKAYADLVQAQMNTDELYLTCINGISSYGRKKMYPLLNKWSFLENLAIDENKAIQQLVYFYYPKTKRKNLTGERGNVIVVAGPEGSRRGALLKLIVKSQIPVRVASVQEVIPHDTRLANLKDNQLAIRELLSKRIDPDDIYVINCNFCQLMADGSNELLPQNLYVDIKPMAVIYIEPTLEYMQMSVGRDDKVELDDTMAELYLQNEETAATDYADYKGVPFYKFKFDEQDKVLAFIKEKVDTY